MGIGPNAASVTAVIAAAGSGQRLGAGGPKAFVPVAGRRLVDWSIEALRAATSVGTLVIACPPGHAGELSGEDLEIVDGGATRAVSVSNALQLVGTELVAIHDAARPLLDPGLVEGVIAALAADPGADGAIAATPVTDTIKWVSEPAPPPLGRASAALTTLYGANAAHVVESTVDRGRLWAAQTPQVFRTEALREALGAWPGRAPSGLDPDRGNDPADPTDPDRGNDPADPTDLDRGNDPADPTDEAMVVEAAGGRVLIHPSPPENLKVTTPLDLRLAELLLADRSAQSAS